MLWGVDDATHDIVGTTFNPLAAKHKGQELELWLRLKLSKNAEFKFIPMDYRGHRTVILRIWPATGYPVAFDGTEYIRSGTSTQPIAKNSQRERRLWEVTKSEAFEDQIAAQWLTAEETLAMLDWNTYFGKQARRYLQIVRKFCITSNRITSSNSLTVAVCHHQPWGIAVCG